MLYRLIMKHCTFDPSLIYEQGHPTICSYEYMFLWLHHPLGTAPKLNVQWTFKICLLVQWMSSWHIEFFYRFICLSFHRFIVVNLSCYRCRPIVLSLHFIVLSFFYVNLETILWYPQNTRVQYSLVFEEFSWQLF